MIYMYIAAILLKIQIDFHECLIIHISFYNLCVMEAMMSI